MSLSFSEIRSAITTKITELSSFKLLRVPPAYFGRTQNTISHLGFTIGIDQSTNSGERFRGDNNNYYLNSIVTVKFLYKLRPLDVYPTDYDLCLEKEELVIKKCLSVYTTQNELRLLYNSSNREVVNSLEYMIVTITFNILHTI